MRGYKGGNIWSRVRIPGFVPGFVSNKFRSKNCWSPNTGFVLPDSIIIGPLNFYLGTDPPETITPASLATPGRDMHLFFPFLFPDSRDAAIGTRALPAIFDHEVTSRMKLQWMDQQDRESLSIMNCLLLNSYLGLESVPSS